MRSKEEKGRCLKASLPYLVFFFVFSLILAAKDVVPPLQVFGFEHTPVATMTLGEKVLFTAVPRGEIDWMTLYYRAPGIAKFQARPMARSSDGACLFELDTSSLVQAELEYYIEAERRGRKLTNPTDAPSGTHKIRGTSPDPLPEIPQNLPSPAAEERRFKLPVHANGTALGILTESEASPGLQNPNGSGNFRVTTSSTPAGRLGFALDSNFSATSVPLPQANAVDLTNMMITVSRGAHALRAGDVNINESEYSVFGLGRRGLEYAFDNQKTYLHFFDVSSQQVKGFKGFGVPAEDVSILGGAAGGKLFKDALAVKAIYVAGKDNPARAVNVGVPSDTPVRQGEVIAGLAETNLFKNAIRLKAEYAQSSYDKDLGDDVAAASDHALNLGGAFSLGGFSIGGGYRFVGTNFNSIGLPYTTNDRKGVEATIAYAKGPVNVQGAFTVQEDNVSDDPSKYTTKGRNGNLALSLTLSPKVTVTAGYRQMGQNTYQGGQEVKLQDSRTAEISSGLNIILGPSASLSLMMTQSSLSSDTNPTSNMKMVTVNLGGSFRGGESVILTPSFGLNVTTNPQTHAKSTNLNSFLNGEVFILRRVLSAFLAGSLNRAETTGSIASRTLDLTTGANFYLGRLIKVENLLLALKGSYRSAVMAGITTTFSRMMIQADFAF